MTALLSGIPIQPVSFERTLAKLKTWLAAPGCRRVATVNTSFLTQCETNPELLRALRTADHVTADGHPVVWLARLAGLQVPERVAGSDLVWPLLEEAARTGARVYFLGASEGTLQKLEAKLHARGLFPRVCGSYTGRVDLDDEAHCTELAEDVSARRTDLLLVALGCPKQDLFLSRYGTQTGARLSLGIGATLDFLAGTRRRAPGVWQRARLEWLFRWTQEPGRLTGRYLADLGFLVRRLLGHACAPRARRARGSTAE